MLANLRTYMLEDAKMNYRSSYKDNIWCSLCCVFPSSQKHIFECIVLRKKLKDKIKFDAFSYSDIDDSLEKQERFAKMFCVLIKYRRELIANQEFSLSESQSTEDISVIFDESLRDAAEAI